MSRLLLLIAFVATGCAPSLAPTYRDYRIPSGASVAGVDDSETPNDLQPDAASGEVRVDLTEKLVGALEEAGWVVRESDASNVISTDVRRIETGAFSSVSASLDLAPLNGRYVRVYIQAVRRNVFGSRTKLPYLSKGLRNRALDDVTEALAGRGLVALDAPQERDEEATD